MSDHPNTWTGGENPLKSAGRINDVMQTVRDHKQRAGMRPPPLMQRTLPYDQATHVAIENTSTEELSIFAIVGLDEFAFDPSLSDGLEGAFLADPVVKASWPATDAHQQRWGVLVAPTIASGVERAVTSGVVIARVVATAVAGDTVGIDEASGHPADDVLDVVSDGIATVILTGVGYSLDPDYQWALIRIGGGGGGASSPLIEFQLSEVDCESHTAIGIVVGVTCGASSPRLGAEVELFDDAGCMLVGDNITLRGRRGFAQKMDVVDGGNQYSYGCPYVIINICGDGFSC